MHQLGTRTGLWSFSDADAYSDESDRSVRGFSYAAVGTAVTSPGDFRRDQVPVAGLYSSALDRRLNFASALEQQPNGQRR